MTEQQILKPIKKVEIIKSILKEHNIPDYPDYYGFFKKLIVFEGDQFNQDLIKKGVQAYNDYLTELNDLPNYPESILTCLRQRLGLDKEDTSLDIEFKKMSPNEAFSEVAKWNGLLGGYSDTILGWVKSIYGVDLASLSLEASQELRKKN